MSTFKDLNSNQPATVGAVTRAIARLSELDELQIQQLASDGGLRGQFAFAVEATFPEDFADEEEILEADPFGSAEDIELDVIETTESMVEEESAAHAEITPLFIKQHYPTLKSVLARRTKNAAVAAEMLNEAIAITISHLRVGRISEPSLLYGYIFGLAMNLYRCYRRVFDNRRGLRAEAVLSPKELAAMLGEMEHSKSEALRLHRASKHKTENDG